MSHDQRSIRKGSWRQTEKNTCKCSPEIKKKTKRIKSLYNNNALRRENSISQQQQITNTRIFVILNENYATYIFCIFNDHYAPHFFLFKVFFFWFSFVCISFDLIRFVGAQLRKIATNNGAYKVNDDDKPSYDHERIHNGCSLKYSIYMLFM